MTTPFRPGRRHLIAPTTALAVALTLAGCAAASDPEAESAATSAQPAAAQDVVFALVEDPTCLDPQQTTMTTALNVGRQLTDSLLDQDPATGEIVPWLATAWSVNEDATAYTFTLRDDVTFSDGTPLTADVVAANLDAVIGLGSSASLANAYLAGYAGAEVSGDTELTVSFAEPNVQFAQGVTTMSLGILSAATVAASPEERCLAPVGTGPFVLDSYVVNDSVDVSKREGYDWPSELRGHQGEAYLDSVSFRIITEASVRTGGLESGEYDLIQDVPYIDEVRFATGEYHLYAAANPGVPNSFIVNTEHGLMGEEAVRQAITKSLDRDQINLLTGSMSGQAPTSVLTSSTPGYTDLGDVLAYDPEGAAALLDAAGWTMGPDGVRERDGQPLTFTVTAFYAQDVLEAAQIQLAEAGIDMQISMVSVGDFFGAIASGDYDALGAALTRTDPDALRVLLSADSPSRWAIVDDSELEGLLQEQARTVDAAARQSVVDSIQRIVAEKAYVIPTLETMQLHASSAAVEGLAFDSASRFTLYDVVVVG